MGSSSPQNLAASPPEAERFGRYEIVSKLAAGGMGEVFLARSVGAAGFQKHVVIKKLLPHLVEQSQFVEGLIREAKLLVRLEHHNIVQVLDLGMEGSDYFMAMEYVHGYNMATIIHYCASKRHLLPPPCCAFTGIEILNGLDYAHSLTSSDGKRQNIIHRDVSPQNVLISREGRVKITDFGIAKVLSDAQQEMTQSLKGKFRYMAPEALEGKPLDQRYDLFAVGIILFEALCRRHLFDGRSDMEILNQIKDLKIPPIQQFNPNAPRSLIQVIEKSLHRDPDQRFQTGADFASKLRESIQPMSDAEAGTQLRNFIADLYERADFPINKAKLPDLSSIVEQDKTKSIVLQSRISPSMKIDLPEEIIQKQEKERTRTGWAITGLTIGFLVLLAAVGWLIYSSTMKPATTSNDKAQVIYIQDRQDKPKPPPTEQPTPATLGVDAKAPTATEQKPAPDSEPTTSPTKTVAKGTRKKPTGTKATTPPTEKIGPFNTAVGQRLFGSQRAALNKCFEDFAATGGGDIKLKIFSSISADGAVTAVNLDPASASSTTWGKCLIKIASQIKYPKHDRPMISFLVPIHLKQNAKGE